MSGPTGRKYGSLFVQTFGPDGSARSQPVYVDPSTDVREVSRLRWRDDELGVLSRELDDVTARKLYLARFSGI